MFDDLIYEKKENCNKKPFGQTTLDFKEKEKEKKTDGSTCIPTGCTSGKSVPTSGKSGKSGKSGTSGYNNRPKEEPDDSGKVFDTQYEPEYTTYDPEPVQESNCEPKLPFEEHGTLQITKTPIVPIYRKLKDGYKLEYHKQTGTVILRFTK